MLYFGNAHFGFIFVKKNLLLCCVENFLPFEKLPSISYFGDFGWEFPIPDGFTIVLQAP